MVVVFKTIMSVLFSITLISAISVFAGCGSAPITDSSGFLSDYNQMKPDTRFEGAQVYENTAVDFDGYKSFIIEGPSIVFAPDAESTTVEPEELEKLSDYFRGELIKQLREKGYLVVQTPGMGVAKIRFAITDLRRTTAALNIHPITKLAGGGLGGASFEAEMLDSKTNSRLLAIVDARQGARVSIEGLGKWDHAKQVMRIWTSELVEYLNAAQGQ